MEATIGMDRLVLSRNFKGKTAAKYCVCRFGDDPHNAVEVNEVTLFDAQVAGTYDHAETREFQSFGCGVILIGYSKMPVTPKPAQLGKIEFNGNGFNYVAEKGFFDRCKQLVATVDGLEVVA